MPIKVEIKGMREALSNLRQLDDRAPDAAAILLSDFVNTKVIAPAKEIVPVDTGNLRSTLRASEPEIHGGLITVQASAGGPSAPYALKVHENPRSGQTGGLSPSGKKYRTWAQTGEWKYLERPALEAANTSKGWLLGAVKGLLSRMRPK